MRNWCGTPAERVAWSAGAPDYSGRIGAARYREHSRQKGLASPVDRARVAEHPRPDHVIAHISDTHLIAGEGDLYGDVDAEGRLSELLGRLEGSQTRPDALIFTGDHANRAALREPLLREAPTMAPMDRVHEIAGLRVIVLDTSVPGHHHGEIAPEQLQWLAAQLAEPPPFGPTR